MSKRVRSGNRRGKRGQRRKASPVVLLFLLLVWSICLGWGLSLVVGATGKPELVAQATSSELGTVDPTFSRYQLGEELYLENCASCHVAMPPQIMPTETWRRLLLEPEQHYGVQLQEMIGPSRLVMWDYLRTYTRPSVEGQPIPYRIAESRFFKALHPRVKFSEAIKPDSCVTCHPGVAQYNYRRLTPDWENSP